MQADCNYSCNSFLAFYNHQLICTDLLIFSPGERLARFVNNISIDVISATSERAKLNGGSIPVEKEIAGTFSMEGSPMFTSILDTGISRFAVGSDEPAALGGKGVMPSPLTYVLYGVLACYASTLAIQCASQGIVLEELKVKGTLTYDIGPVVVESGLPIIKKLKIEVTANRDIREIIALSRRRCPALFAIEHPIETELVQK